MLYSNKFCLRRLERLLTYIESLKTECRKVSRKTQYGECSHLSNVISFKNMTIPKVKLCRKRVSFFRTIQIL
jgi:hypothetical protein